MTQGTARHRKAQLKEAEHTPGLASRGRRAIHIHVAFFNRSFYPETAATGQLLTELAEDLVRQHGCRVSVVAGAPLVSTGGETRASKRGLLLQREQYQGIQIFRARGTRFSRRSLAGRVVNYLTYFVSACYAGLRLDRPNVVVALTDPPIIGLAGYLAARRFGASFAMSYRDIYPEATRLLDGFKSEAVNRVLQLVNCLLVRKADRVMALGETMRRRLIDGKGADPAKVCVIPDWADASAIVPGRKENAFASSHGLSDKFVVMHSGNIGLAQGLETLIDAAALLRQHQDIQVVVVGDGVRRPELEARAQRLGLGNVQFLPFQQKERLVESFATADVFAVALRRGLAGYIVPSKLYGIMAAGRPYVAAVEDDCEIAMLTREHGCGLVADPENAVDLAEKILWLYQHPTQRARMGVNARSAAMAFDRPLQVKAYLELFQAMLRARGPGWSLRARLAKRGFDVAVSSLALVASAPLWLIIPWCIKLEDGGPVFYGQERVSRGGGRFRSWKFRSMVRDSDARFGPLQARRRDPRITRVGRLLRPTALDELPQLWNILRGDMSFVGPRALLPTEIEVNGRGGSISVEEIPGYEERHWIRPGLTGLAQVYAPRDIARRNKFRFDLLYLERRGFWLDLKVFLLSVWISLRGRWESAGPKSNI